VRLVRLYSNQPHLFEPIEFNDGFSVVLGEIRIPENRNLDTHNLGKTTIAQLIDFCLLKGKDPSFFLFKHEDRFAGFKFFIEIRLPDGGFLTIGRAVVPGSKVDLKRSETSIPDAAELEDSAWDHPTVAFERARSLLDGMLGSEALRPWGFRNVVGYLIRSQYDYQDVFQLGKFSGKHQSWKPFVAHLLGMEAGLAKDLYEKRDARDQAAETLRTIIGDWGADNTDPSVISGLIAVKERQIEQKQAGLDSLNFRDEDARTTAEVVEETEARIAALNEERYRLTNLVSRLEDSLRDKQIVFKPADAKALFEQAGVVLPDQIEKEYEQLIAFNRAITAERRDALMSQLDSSRERIATINGELEVLNAKRTQSLGFLRESDAVTKFKDLSGELTALRAELNTLESKLEAASRLGELRREHRTLTEQFNEFQTRAEEQIAEISRDEKSLFARLRRHFGEIVQEVVGQNAILAIKVNASGGLDFTAEFITEAGVATAGDEGTSYKKLLCIAFDLAMLRAYEGVSFPRFVYHDGALEQLELRKREKLIGVFREYVSYGIQPIITVLDSDLPASIDETPRTVARSEVIVTLHDDGKDGRLFKMEPW